MPPTADECENFIRDIISDKERYELTYSMIIACWMLQGDDEYPHRFPRQDLIHLMGDDLKTDVQSELRTTFIRHGFIEIIDDEDELHLSQNMLSAIRHVDTEQTEYQLQSPISRFNGKVIGDHASINGLRFMKYINAMRELKSRQLVDMVADAIKSLSPRQIGISDPFSDSSPIRLLYYEGKWEFFLVVTPSPGMLPAAVANEELRLISKHNLRLVGQQKQPIRAIFISPRIEVDAGNELLADHPFVHPLWSLNTIEFFRLLDTEFNGQEEVVAANFFRIFPEGDTGPLLPREAIARLKKK